MVLFVGWLFWFGFRFFVLFLICGVMVCFFFPLGPCLIPAKREVAGNVINLVGLQEPNNI